MAAKQPALIQSLGNIPDKEYIANVYNVSHRAHQAGSDLREVIDLSMQVELQCEELIDSPIFPLLYSPQNDNQALLKFDEAEHFLKSAAGSVSLDITSKGLSLEAKIGNGPWKRYHCPHGITVKGAKHDEDAPIIDPPAKLTLACKGMSVDTANNGWVVNQVRVRFPGKSKDELIQEDTEAQAKQQARKETAKQRKATAAKESGQLEVANAEGTEAPPAKGKQPAKKAPARKPAAKPASRKAAAAKDKLYPATAAQLDKLPEQFKVFVQLAVDNTLRWFTKQSDGLYLEDETEATAGEPMQVDSTQLADLITGVKHVSPAPNNGNMPRWAEALPPYSDGKD